MALVASPPPEDVLSQSQQVQLDNLETEIETATSDIAALTKKNALLAASLLGSNEIRGQLHQHLEKHSDPALKALLDDRQSRHQNNIHRLAYGITAFPFIDPSPDTSNRPLLGIRFDVHRHGGTFDAAYYVFCKRSTDHSMELALYKHTIPTFIPIDRYRARYLPLTDEGYGSGDSLEMAEFTRQQDLQAFVTQLRSDLVAWRLRQDSIEEVGRRLGLRSTTSKTKSDDDLFSPDAHGVVLFEAVATDASYVSISWADGRVGRLKIGPLLQIEKAAIFRRINGEQQRDNESESVVLSQEATLSSLPDRLRMLHQRRSSS